MNADAGVNNTLPKYHCSTCKLNLKVKTQRMLVHSNIYLWHLCCNSFTVYFVSQSTWSYKWTYPVCTINSATSLIFWANTLWLDLLQTFPVIREIALMCFIDTERVINRISWYPTGYIRNVFNTQNNHFLNTITNTEISLKFSLKPSIFSVMT